MALFSVHIFQTSPGSCAIDFARPSIAMVISGPNGPWYLKLVVEEHGGPVMDVGIALHVEIVFSQGIIGKGVLLVAEYALSADYIGKDRVSARSFVDELGAGREHDVEIFRIYDYVPDWPLFALHSPGNDLDLRPALCNDLRNLVALDVSVPRGHHLVGSWEIGPELKTFHHAVIIPFGHLLVDNAASSRHPLHVSRRDDALVAHAVADNAMGGDTR